jgi:hypothetical protein
MRGHFTEYGPLDPVLAAWSNPRLPVQSAFQSGYAEVLPHQIPLRLEVDAVLYPTPLQAGRRCPS